MDFGLSKKSFIGKYYLFTPPSHHESQNFVVKTSCASVWKMLFILLKLTPLLLDFIYVFRGKLKPPCFPIVNFPGLFTMNV